MSQASRVENGAQLNAVVSTAASPVLEIDNLQTHFFTPAGVVKAVDGVSYSVRSGETLGVVGESGCGKSVTALSILRLVADPPGRIVGGAIRFEGRNLLDLQPQQMEEIRGNEISMIFQEPMTSLNPVYTVGTPDQRGDRPAPGHLAGARPCDKAVDMLRRGVHPGARAARARLSAPDVGRHAPARDDRHGAVVQSEGPDRRRADHRARRDDPGADPRPHARAAAGYGMAMMLITHDMGVVAENADRVIVMYAGKKVEEADVDDLFERPAHPYTRGLLGSIPHLDEAAKPGAARVRLNEIKGMVPSLVQLPPGCSFAPRAATPPIDAAASRRRSSSIGPATGWPAGTPTACAGMSVRRRRGMRAVCRRRAGRTGTRRARCSRCGTSASTSRSSRGCSRGSRRQVHAVDGVSFRIEPGRRWGWSARAAAASRRWGARC